MISKLSNLKEIRSAIRASQQGKGKNVYLDCGGIAVRVIGVTPRNMLSLMNGKVVIFESNLNIFEN